MYDKPRARQHLQADKGRQRKICQRKTAKVRTVLLQKMDTDGVILNERSGAHN